MTIRRQRNIRLGLKTFEEREPDIYDGENIGKGCESQFRDLDAIRLRREESQAAFLETRQNGK